MSEIPSTPVTAANLLQKRCLPCEGGVPPFSTAEVAAHRSACPDWEVTSDGLRLRRCWLAKNFIAAMDFFHKVATVAENLGHHPDLHLERYRQVTIEIYTHAVGGLTENDFILAAHIDALPIAVKQPSA